jgi:hypothetical protein
LIIFSGFQIFYPLALAGTLFSMQGVLPFTPNLGRFFSVMLILAALLGATLIVCFNWALWSQRIVNCLAIDMTSDTRKPTMDHDDEGPNQEETRGKATLPRDLKRTFIPRGLRKAEMRRHGDLEGGPEGER